MDLKGKIIAIEGTDGSGKQTQVKRLTEKLKACGYEVYSTSFPNYSSDSSAPLRMYLNGEICSSPSDVNAKAASTFFAIDRYITYKREIEKIYKEKEKVFVFDRYVASNIIHQGAKLMTQKNVNYERLESFIIWLDSLEHEVFQIPKADVTIYLNVPLDYTKILRANRANKINNTDKQDIHESDDAYLNRCTITGLAAAKLLNWDVVECIREDTMRSTDDIANEIWNIISSKI